jgi:acyl-CoA thioester hydrolase
MAYTFKMKKRVEFSETDMAGIVHFSNFFRYMEMTEHAFFRSLGYSVHAEIDGVNYGWPRVSVSCDYRKPVRFEDELEIELLIVEKKAKAIEYRFVLRQVLADSNPIVAIGTVVTVCVAMDGEDGMKSMPIPEALASLIETAPAEVLRGGML